MSSAQREKRQRNNDMSTDDMEGMDHEEQVTPRVKKMREDVSPSASSSQEAIAEKTNSSMDTEAEF